MFTIISTSKEVVYVFVLHLVYGDSCGDNLFNDTKCSSLSSSSLHMCAFESFGWHHNHIVTKPIERSVVKRSVISTVITIYF